MTEQAPTVERTDPTQRALDFLQQRFGDAVQPDNREGYTGLIVSAGPAGRSRRRRAG